MRKLSTRDSWLEYQDVLAKREPFTTSGALRGTDDPFAWETGRLPAEYHESFKHATYAAYSYNTPIAWYRTDTGSWEFPYVKYSVTTTRHQMKIRTALQYENIRGE